MSFSCKQAKQSESDGSDQQQENQVHPDTVIQQMSLDYKLTYLYKLPANADSTVVFSRAGQGDVTIQKRYCDELDEPTRAILFYYASKFSTGFDTAGHPLLIKALNSDTKNYNGDELIQKWFQGPDQIKLKNANISAVLPDGASNSTWFTFIAVKKEKDIRKVYFRTLDTGDEEKYKAATDVFKITGNHIEVLDIHEFGE
ncbi:hypothetical protein TH53_07030 [Pedobacter lusitanus]|uniref:Contig28, whole genome shotgun sequence n=1 Tax=Pedobacter lusitanus TaxID=1503925 RepID=A0A0D0GP26_9SPHI|nr:hypothetical protein TH53_07030 [Pedobacter lusitanus]